MTARTPDRRAEAVRALAQALGHDFRDPGLLERALTHASVGEGAERDARGRPFLDNQRLEFLGDRVLGLLDAQLRTGRYPQAAAFLRRRLSGSHQSPRDLYRLGWALRGLGRSEEATVTYRAALAAWPEAESDAPKLMALHAAFRPA